jgi:hypothetical protein
MDIGRILGLALVIGALMAHAQGSNQEFRPEFGIYLNCGSRTRVVFDNTVAQTAQNTRSGFSATCTRPVSATAAPLRKIA